MFYTNRRANAPGLSGVAWVHGTRIGIAESDDGGASCHLTSRDFRKWSDARVIPLASDRVIDASVARLDDGRWRLFYNDERAHKSIRYDDSTDLVTRTDRGPVVTDQSGEGVDGTTSVPARVRVP